MRVMTIALMKEPPVEGKKPSSLDLRSYAYFDANSYLSSKGLLLAHNPVAFLLVPPVPIPVSKDILSFLRDASLTPQASAFIQLRK